MRYRERRDYGSYLSDYYRDVTRDVGGVCSLWPRYLGGNDSSDIGRCGCGLYARRCADAGSRDVAELGLDTKLGLDTQLSFNGHLCDLNSPLGSWTRNGLSRARRLDGSFHCLGGTGRLYRLFDCLGECNSLYRGRWNQNSHDGCRPGRYRGAWLRVCG